MNELIVATNNQHKIQEIKAILGNMEIKSLKEVGIDIEVEEDKDTFEGNALKKAKTIAKITGKPCIADDSGLCIEALNGFPGVKTARFLGEDATASEKNQYLIKQLEGLEKEKRKAQFVCCIALVIPNKEEKTFFGTLSGYIATEEKGSNGFQQDHIFELENGKVVAELTAEGKNQISHRHEALMKLKEYLKLK